MILEIINPIFALQNEEKNIFTIRKTDYSNILDLARQILEPVTKIGFNIAELDLKDSRISSGELSKTLKQTLSIKLQKGSSTIDLSLLIPKLADDNYIVINGRKKIPLFQLFDIPLVTRGNNIKLRTNVATLMISKEKSGNFYINLSFLSKKISLGLLLIAYFGPDELEKRFSFKSFIPPFVRGKEIEFEKVPLMNLLLADIKEIFNTGTSYTEEDYLIEIGRNYSKYNAKSKGQDILYALDLISQVDPITARFLTTGSIIEEMLYALQIVNLDDTLFTNKRVRCFEYVVGAKLSKIVFDFCLSNRNSRQPKFNINSTQILSDCNVSEIVQFDFSINPIEELTKLSRISLLGPGGFKRENIPHHLRDICPSMFGRVCPVDTPDRDNCGVLQNLIPNVDLDDNLKFTSTIALKQPISIPVSLVPLCEHDDQTRLQMASSQMRQAILLKNFDRPLVMSGCENLYTDKTQFIKIAKKDGEVIYIDNKCLIVVYDDNTLDIFDIGYRRIYVEHMDLLSWYFKQGDKFKKGDVLAESSFSQDKIIQFGKNLLTGVMVYYGNNYEDGIVISDRLVNEKVLTAVQFKDMSFVIPPNKVLLSLAENTYKPLPNELEWIQPGQTYAILKTLSIEDTYSVFTEDIKYESDRCLIIPEVNIYANEWNTDIPQYNKWIEEKIAAQQEKEIALRETIKDKVSREDANKFIKEHSLDISTFTGKYKIKKERIPGILVEMYGIYFRDVKVGDKLANRHGNKGVISRIVAHNKMPQTEDGRHLDICINPLGIISRMNIGQLFELHLGMSVQDFKTNLLKMLEKNIEQNTIKNYIIEYIKIIDKTEGNWYLNQVINQLPEIITQKFIEDFTIIQAPFESCKLEDVEKALKYTGSKFKQKIYDPLSKEMIRNQIAVGFLYFFRMVHIAEEKLAARGIGSYTKRTLQPLGGRKNKGGQRAGEMEIACIIGHDAPINLFEFLTTKSDCIDLKNKYIRNFIDPNLVPEEDKGTDIIPESVKLLNSYLTVIGVDYKDT